jgi:hypothetical protein
VRDLADALARNEVTQATPPRRATLAGHDGLRLTLRLPADFDIDRCPSGRVQLWEDAGGGNRYLEQPGQRLRLWILDLDGQRVVVNASDGPANTAEEVAEVTRMVRSVTFTGALEAAQGN